MISISVTSYSDFQTVITSLPFKIGNFYYKFTSGGGFFAVAYSADFNGVISVSQSLLPSTLSTDYPNAIQLTDTAPVLGSNFNLF